MMIFLVECAAVLAFWFAGAAMLAHLDKRRWGSKSLRWVNKRAPEKRTPYLPSPSPELIEAMREVDALLPNTPPIAPPVVPPRPELNAAVERAIAFARSAAPPVREPPPLSIPV